MQRVKLHPPNPLARLPGEIQRCIQVVGSFAHEHALTRPLLDERNAAGTVLRARPKALAASAPGSDKTTVKLPAAAA